VKNPHTDVVATPSILKLLPQDGFIIGKRDSNVISNPNVNENFKLPI